MEKMERKFRTLFEIAKEDRERRGGPDFGFKKKLLGRKWAPVDSPLKTHDWIWEELGEETRFIVNGREYSSREEAVEDLFEQGIFSKKEAEDYLDTLVIEDWRDRRLSLEETLKYKKKFRDAGK